MKEKDIQDNLASIRNLMERSSKFISLSGLSGILAGVYALIGAGLAHNLIKNSPLALTGESSFFELLGNDIHILYSLSIIALVILVASIVTAIILSAKKAKKSHQTIWNNTSRSLLLNMSVPLLTGGIIIIAFIFQGCFSMIVPSMLIFYGLSLFNAGNFTFADIRYLGILEIILGLISICLPGCGLLFWAIGFGVLHIVYGSVMYLKYDR